MVPSVAFPASALFDSFAVAPCKNADFVAMVPFPVTAFPPFPQSTSPPIAVTFPFPSIVALSRSIATPPSL